MSILDVRPPDWQSRAACAGSDPALFDLDGVSHGRTKAQVWEMTAPARAICARCPVQADCLALVVGDRSSASVVAGGHVYLNGVRVTDDATTHVPGVYYSEDSPKHPWKAVISVKHKDIYLGAYTSRARAVAARRAAEEKYRKEAA